MPAKRLGLVRIELSSLDHDQFVSANFADSAERNAPRIIFFGSA